MPGASGLDVSVDVIEEDIDQEAGDRDVEPDGEGPPGQPGMGFEPGFPGQVEEAEDQGDDDDRQDHVGEENGEVENLGKPHSGERWVPVRE